ncbi:RING finger protein [Oscillospiraceae bacterium PP1C4]
MANYVGVHCPVCDKRFVENDDVVVCPICGAPHHRACYHELGHCALNDLHIQGHTWQPPENLRNERKETSMQELTCSSCGANNPQNSIFCQVCGALLGKQATDSTQGNYPQGYSPFGQNKNVGAAKPNAYTMAFGGLSPEEEIDGVSARDIALFIGANSHYYLPRFQQLSKRTGISFNWGALLFNFLYFFYRKMYLMGAALLALLALTQIPALFIAQEYTSFILANFEDISIGIKPVFEPHNNLWAYAVIPYIRYVTLISGLLFSGLANRIYKSHVLKNIRKIKENLTDEAGYLDDKQYTELLVCRGRTSRTAVVVAIIGIIAAYIGICFAVAFSVL